MSEGRVKVKMLDVVDELEPKTTAKGQEIFPTISLIEVDGKVVEGEIAVTCWGKTALEAFKAGTELDGSVKEWQGKEQYTVFAPREQKSLGGGGGFRGGGKSPAEQGMIRRQVAFKGVIDLICAGKLDIKQFLASLDEMDKALIPSEG